MTQVIVVTNVILLAQVNKPAAINMMVGAQSAVVRWSLTNDPNPSHRMDALRLPKET